MNALQAARYARVASAQPSPAQTTASQRAVLRERIAADGLRLPQAQAFIDDGYRMTATG